MNKNNPINSVYLIALALVSIISFVDTLYEAVVFAVVVVSVFLFSISVVSMIEKIADKHVKFLAFALISSALVTLLKVVFKYVNVGLVVSMAEVIDIAIIPCLLMSIVPIYFEDSLSVKEYFTSSLLMSFGIILMLGLFGSITEAVGYGTFLDKAFLADFNGIEFFTFSYGKLIVVAIITVMFNIIRRAYLKSTRRQRMLIEKYKIQIREIRSSNLRQKQNDGGDK